MNESLFQCRNHFHCPGKVCTWRGNFPPFVSSLSKSLFCIFTWWYTCFTKALIISLIISVAVSRSCQNAYWSKSQPVEGFQEQRKRCWGNFHENILLSSQVCDITVIINVQEMRRRCTEVNVELWKAKKEDHLLKRRNLEVDDFEPLSPLQEQNRMAAANMTIEDIVNGEF